MPGRDRQIRSRAATVLRRWTAEPPVTRVPGHRFLKEGVTGREPNVWVFCGVCLLFTRAAVFGASDLARFDGWPQTAVQASGWSVAFVCTLTFWTWPILVWVAAARRNQGRQLLEWSLFYVSLVLVLASMLLTGSLTKLYGGAHGYRFCSSTHAMPSDLTFAKVGRPCPYVAPDEHGPKLTLERS